MFKVCAELTVGVEIPSLEVLCGGDCGNVKTLMGAIKAIWARRAQRDGGERRSRRAAGYASRPFIPVLLFKNYCLKSE